jgi:putative transposase
VPIHPLPRSGRETGIDVGLTMFLITADGDIVANPRCHRTAERALKKAHKCVSRRKKGSMRHKKAVRWLARKPSARAPAALRLSPQDGVDVGTSVQHHLR